MVEQLWRYLVKSAQGESLAELAFDLDGPRLDRSWACLDAEGIVVSAKQPRRWGRLLEVHAWAVDEATVIVQVPGCAPMTAGTAEADETLSRWLGAPVHLSRTVPARPQVHRLFPRESGMRPSWASELPEDTVTALKSGARFVDFGAVHVVTVGDLEALRAEGAGDAEARRFRPNLVLSIDRLEAGHVIRFDGGVELQVTLPTPRCAVPGVAQPGVTASTDVLRAVGRRRTEIPGFGTAACFGVYADVRAPGLVRQGERARLAS
jgi:uncharacterized protein